MSGDVLPAPPVGRRWWRWLKVFLFVTTLIFVGRYSWGLWERARGETVTVTWGWLAPAVVFYVLAWVPSVVFWRMLLVASGFRPSTGQVANAYYCGHLGKYVPGKALALVIRGTLLKPLAVPMRVSILTAGYETLASMGTGAAIATALVPWTFPAFFRERLAGFAAEGPWLVWLVPLAVLAIIVVSLPINARLTNQIARKLAKFPEQDSQPLTGRTLGKGMLILSVGWLLQAAALGCTLRALAPVTLDLSSGLAWLAAVTWSTVGGFVVLFAPGGIGPREWVLMQVLAQQPGLSEAAILATAFALRCVSLVGEFLAASALYAIYSRTPVIADATTGTST